MTIKEKMTDLLNQEALLQFDTFSNKRAYEIGLMLVKQAEKENKPVTIDITRNNHQLFHVAMEGTSSDNDAWVKRKSNVANRFGHSSMYMSLKMEIKGGTMEEAYFLDSADFAAHGGSFPIIIRDTGVIGTITVSGLPSEQDHQMVINVLSEYLKVKL
ncbi:heme-degrading domain-containing protein [Petrocella sp. FN5]|uniref:heme-degrading domain-containing protein n=1 Tax=Petrocella sp. FN5 TaxID=3032002 RepID=UPI0023DAB640|nr:heme-degrading domain-containing protein [Petrocella sp. FN5]MDF1617203.1 heme-degrading domain-containing protein [Petrocella sp. FN5]